MGRREVRRPSAPAVSSTISPSIASSSSATSFSITMSGACEPDLSGSAGSGGPRRVGIAQAWWRRERVQQHPGPGRERRISAASSVRTKAGGCS